MKTSSNQLKIRAAPHLYLYKYEKQAMHIPICMHMYVSIMYVYVNKLALSTFVSRPDS